MLWNKHSISFKIPRYELLQQKFNWYSISKRVDTLIAILWRFGQKSGPFFEDGIGWLKSVAWDLYSTMKKNKDINSDRK